MWSIAKVVKCVIADFFPSTLASNLRPSLWGERLLHVELLPCPPAQVKYTSGLASGGTFYTDANGREMQRRERDARPTWTLDVHEPVAGNYYPLTSAMYIEVGALCRDAALCLDGCR